ncbi:MAG: MotA/TolQ/ExbB proton channel family protein, partial [Janthinobacterium lividum]
MNPTTASQSMSLSHYWAQGDAVSHGVAYALVLMSIISWFYIISKGWSSLRIRRSASSLDGFWKAPTLDDAVAVISASDSENIYTPMARHSVEASNFRLQEGSLNAAV